MPSSISNFVFRLSVSSTLGQDRDVNVTLSINNKSTVSKLIRVPAMSHAAREHNLDPIGDRGL